MNAIREGVADAVLDELRSRRGFDAALDLDDAVLADLREAVSAAAIRAMREPTPEMFQAAGDTPGVMAMNEHLSRAAVAIGDDVAIKLDEGGSPLHQAYQAMIDEVLA